MKRTIAAVLMGWGLCGGLSVRAGEPEKSTVHITTFVQEPIWDAPWRFQSMQQMTGSGFVIGGKRIMTNAHVVSWGQQVLVQRHQDPHPYVARVKFIGHDCDLALLEVEDASFFNGIVPLDFGGLPKVRSMVFTYGYPAGGDQISYTKGVVSRIEMQSYAHAGNRGFLAVQTDAAINPGNSGGPVIQDGKVVGVAFQGIEGLQNTGFFIPTPIIRHFLDDVADGVYDGFPQGGMNVVALENPAYRRFLKLPEKGLGVRIDSLLPFPTTMELVRPDDVLLQVGPYPVGSDGMIMYEGNRVSAGVAFDQPQQKGSVALKLWRQGRAIDVSLPMFVHNDDAAEGNQYDKLPRYFVYGGLVFVPLTMEYLKTCGAAFEPELRYQLFCRNYEFPEKRRKETVVLASLLTHPVNADMKVRGRVIVEKINGIQINSLEDVIRAIESNKATHHMFEYGPSLCFETLSRREADAANADILLKHGVPKDRRE